MDMLEPPASHHVIAAFGWLELGNPTEALAELQRIEPELRSQPAVQAARLDCLMAAKQWDDAAKLAEVLCAQCPKEAGLWLHYAYSTRRRAGGSIEQAYQILAPMQAIFPDEWLIGYNLACYLCQMNRLGEAEEMLAEARTVGGEKVDQLADDDEDLAPLRENDS
jgi:predicted Zn-dependent protease|tara:strand:- start:1617 stop:2111 length:495 start_codon:yes stop_codon:yes gene_type:complete